MNEPGAYLAIGTRLAAFLELLRAISGLVAIVVLGAAMASMVLADQPAEPARLSLAIAPARPASPPPSPQLQGTLFYVVRNHAQERLAVWSEGERAVASEPRPYRIVYARDDRELRRVGETILNEALLSQGVVEIVDLRHIE